MIRGRSSSKKGATMRLGAYTSAFVLLSVLALSFAGCPGGSGLATDDPCGQVMAIKCERISTCGGETALTSFGYASVADCTQRLSEANCTQTQPACDPGSNCLDSLRAQSCADFTSGLEPAACSYSCIPGAAGTGGDSGSGGYGAWGGNGGGGIYGGWGGDGGSGPSIGGAGGSSSALSAIVACNEAIVAICERSFYCGGAAALAELGFSSTSDCIRQRQSVNCTSQAPCGPGETFDSDQARRCIAGLQVEACPDFTSGIDPAACSLVCRGTGGAIGGSYGSGGWNGSGGWGGYGGWGGDVGGWGGWGGYGGWGGDVGGYGGWGGDVGGQIGWPWSSSP